MVVEISLIIPIFNEEENIIPLYRELKENLANIGKSHEIIFVDDGSCDNSLLYLKKIHDQDASVKIVKFRKNFGQSAAMKAGFDYSVGSLIVTMDADMQNDPKDIIKMIKILDEQNLDVVCGWRRLRRDPILKKITSKFANHFRTFLTGESTHDSGCTLRVYREECIKDLELYGELHRYIPTMLIWKGFRVGECETNHRERAFGKTKYSWNRIIKGFLDLIVITFWQKYSFRPIHLFGSSGLIIALLGFLLTSYLIFSRLFFGTPLTDRPLFLVALVLFIVGIQFIVFGIIADILLKIYYGQNGRKNYLVDKFFN